MTTTLRTLHEHELPEAADLFLLSVNGLMQRFSLPRVAIPKALQTEAYRHVFRTGIFEVAEIEGRLGAIACAIVREDQWFLSGFWARPELAHRGVGGPLLDRVFAAGRSRGARRFFTWSSSDPTAMASYLRRDLWAAGPIFSFVGRVPPQPTTGIVALELDPEATAMLDRAVRGAKRTEDHAYLLANATGRRFERAGRVIGYGYAQGSVVGPVAWEDPADAQILLDATSALATGPEVRIAIPSVNLAALRWALDLRFQLFWFSHLMQSAPFGDLARYVPSGPLLF